MSSRWNIAFAVALLATLFIPFCGKEKSPPAPPVDPTPEVVPPSPHAQDSPTVPPAPGATSPEKGRPTVFLLSPTPGTESLHAQLQEAAESANLDFSGSDPAVTIATLPLLKNPKSEIRNPKLILVGIPEFGVELPPHLTLIRPDFRAYGDAGGRRIIDELAARAERRGRANIAGKIVQIRATDEDPASIQLFAGFIGHLDKHAGAIFVHDGPGFWREADARKRMEEALRIQKNITLVFAHSELMARGARSAIDVYRKAHPDSPEIPVIGIGGVDALAISLRPLAEKAIEVAARLRADPGYIPPAEIAVEPQP